MQEEITLIHERRKNIYLFLLGILFIVVISYLMVNSITDKLIATIEDARVEYRPMVNNLNASAGVAGEGVKQISLKGAEMMDQFSKEFPGAVSETMTGVKEEYDASQQQVVGEYNTLKSVVDTDYQQLKVELTQLKGDMRRDIDWVKTELAEWRVLISWIAFGFGLVLTLMSIQDILENSRWFIGFIKGGFKRREKKGLPE